MTKLWGVGEPPLSPACHMSARLAWRNNTSNKGLPRSRSRSSGEQHMNLRYYSPEICRGEKGGRQRQSPVGGSLIACRFDARNTNCGSASSMHTSNVRHQGSASLTPSTSQYCVAISITHDITGSNSAS